MQTPVNSILNYITRIVKGLRDQLFKVFLPMKEYLTKSLYHHLLLSYFQPSWWSFDLAFPVTLSSYKHLSTFSGGGSIARPWPRFASGVAVFAECVTFTAAIFSFYKFEIVSLASDAILKRITRIFNTLFYFQNCNNTNFYALYHKKMERDKTSFHIL